MAEKTQHHEENSGLSAEEFAAKQAASEARNRQGGENLEDFDPASEGDSTGEVELDPLAALVGDLRDVHAKKDELQEQLLRNAAEMENLRKRTRREVADARSFAIAGFARDLLGVSDNLRRAIDAVPQEEVDADTGGLKTLIDGVSLTEREMLSTLDKHGVKRVEPFDKKFDPNFHQAMFEVQNPDVANNTIVEVVQAGYVIGERVLRPAMVGVAKGGPKTSAPVEEIQSEENSDEGRDKS